MTDRPARHAVYGELMWPKWNRRSESYGVGGKDQADALLDAHAAEVRAATLAEADAAITAAIERDRALFPARSSDRAALGAAREIIRNLATPPSRPADAQPQDGPRCVCGDPIEWADYEDEPGWIHSPGSDTPCLNARPACRWPDCLTPERRRLLDQQVDAGMRGMPTAPIPDQRGACGCAGRPADDTQQQEPQSTADTGWPCSWRECTEQATHAIAFRDQARHVHDCQWHTAGIREWSDVTAVVPLPCPWPHGDSGTWTDTLHDLT